ncbi:NtrC family transcriptional regulator [Salmonella enterica subsp. arizonae]|uniref:NtrC family transcriptional regulator n=1 Tax=Salmonella enterica subsp. arizonae TaxID=59203 RepID=A0A3S4G321_SALER|nr:NtrC family transcriptional regulator [Salmonella enterica subsp. arizonae]
MRRIEIVLGELERLTRGLCLADLAHPPRYGDQIEERVTLLIGCVEQVLVNPLRKHFLALIGYVQRGYGYLQRRESL